MKKMILIMKKNQLERYYEREKDIYEKNGLLNVDILVERNGKRRVKTLSLKMN